MNDEIGLADLIYQRREELLARPSAEEAKGLPALFWIDQQKALQHFSRTGLTRELESE